MILYEDTALVVVDKPAGLSSEDGVPAALRKLWDRPDAYVGVIHRLDTGVSGLMVYAKTPQTAACGHEYKKACNEPLSYLRFPPSMSRNPCGHGIYILPMPSVA